METIYTYKLREVFLDDNDEIQYASTMGTVARFIDKEKAHDRLKKLEAVKGSDVVEFYGDFTPYDIYTFYGLFATHIENGKIVKERLICSFYANTTITALRGKKIALRNK